MAEILQNGTLNFKLLELAQNWANLFNLEECGGLMERRCDEMGRPGVWWWDLLFSWKQADHCCHAKHNSVVQLILKD